MKPYTYGRKPYLSWISKMLNKIALLGRAIFKQLFKASKSLEFYAQKLHNKSEGKTFTILKIEVLKPWVADIKFQYQGDSNIYHIILTGDDNPYLAYMKNSDKRIEIEDKYNYVVRALEHTKVRQ